MIPDPRVLSMITPDLNLIIWLSQVSLNIQTTTFPTLDYLLDGLARSQLQSQGPLDQVHFTHQHFGQRFHLSYANALQAHPSHFVENLQALLNGKSPLSWALVTEETIPTHWPSILERSLGPSRLSISL